MFRDLMPILADRYRVIAPDLPGFGNTAAPPRGQFDYTFDNLAATVDAFLEAMQLDRYALYIFDYGAPVGLRIASKHPERVTAIVSQNGNAYLEGSGNSWSIWQAYWREPTPAHREACRVSLSPDTIRNWQYFDGSDRAHVSPDGYTLDIAYMARPRPNRDPARPDPRLSQQRRALPAFPGVSPRASPTTAGGVGQEGCPFRSGRCTRLSNRRARRRDPHGPRRSPPQSTAPSSP